MKWYMEQKYDDEGMKKCKCEYKKAKRIETRTLERVERETKKERKKLIRDEMRKYDSMREKMRCE